MTGVGRAIAGQVQATRKLGLPIDFWVIGGEGQAPEGVFGERVSGPLLSRASRLLKARALASIEGLRKYDVILLRYPGGLDLDPLALLRNRRNRVATVHHTKEVPEIVSGGRTARSLPRAALEWVNGRRILSNVDGLVGVTDEIRDYETHRSRRAVIAATIANGIDVASIAHTGFVPFDGRELRLLFIAGSHAPWHGTDRLLASLAQYNGATRVHLDMVGSAKELPGTRTVRGPVTIDYHGTLKGDALDACFSGATLAVSSLAMFRNGLEQGCVLKSREYVARGMPLVVGYDDVDLRGDLPFCLRVPNDDSLLDLERLLDFAARTSAQENLTETIRGFAVNELDWSRKMLQFSNFATSLAATR